MEKSNIMGISMIKWMVYIFLIGFSKITHPSFWVPPFQKTSIDVGRCWNMIGSG